MIRVTKTILLSIAAICLSCAAIMLWSGAETERAYRELEKTVSTEDERGDGIDWSALLRSNDETIGHITVEGTNIAYPVVQPGNARPRNWYLTHDFWRNPSALGCPYLDRRSNPEGKHLLIFGHHTGLSNRMFSTLHDCYNQDAFDCLGTARWSTPQLETVNFKPLMALNIDRDYGKIQRFTFPEHVETDENRLQSWLTALLNDARASCSDAQTQIDGAKRVLTLVTCSSIGYGERMRTMVIFTAQ